MEEAQSVEEFAGKFNAVVNKIKSLGDKLEDEVAVKKYLHVLPENFLPVVTTLMYSQDLAKMKIEEAAEALKAHEGLLKGYKAHNDQALLMKSDNRENEQFHKDQFHDNQGSVWRGCGGRGYSRGQGGRGSFVGCGNISFSGDKSKIKCFECDKLGHYAYECRSHIQCYVSKIRSLCI